MYGYAQEMKPSELPLPTGKATDTSLPWSSLKPLHTIQKTTLVPIYYFQVSLSWSIILTFIIFHITKAI